MTDNNSSSIRRFLDQSTSQVNRSNERLSSGKRINRAADDAAGLAIAQALFAEERTLSVASRNISDGVSVAQIQDAAITSISDISVRQAELAAQAANGTLSDEQRAALNTEYQALGQEAQRIAATSEFNGVNVLSSGVNLQVGTDSSANSQVTLQGASTEALTGAIGNILTAGAAVSALDGAKGRINTAATNRGELGASASRLETADANVISRRENVVAARARIEDADIATETANRISALIRRDAATAVQAQANISVSAVQRLLQ
jgi:flagellin